MSNSKENGNLSLNNGSHTRNSVESRGSNKFDTVNSFEKFKRRWKPATAVFILTVGATVAASNLLKIQYQAQGKLLYKSNSTTSITDMGEEGRDLKSLPNNEIHLLTQKEIISSAPILQETIDILKLKDKSGNPMQPQYLKKKLDVRVEDGSDVITIAYKDQDSHNTANIVNTLMDVYLKEEIRSSKSQTANADSFLNNQIPQVENNLKKYESILQEFRAKNNVLDLQEEKKILVNELGELNSQIASVGADVQGTKAQTSALQSQLGLNFNQAITINQLGNSPTIQSVLTQLAQTESELAEERKRFKETHPTITSLLDKKASLNRYLQQTISSKVGRKVKVSDGLLYNGNSVKETPLDRFITLKIQELSQQTQLASLYEYQKVYLQRAKELPKLEQQEQEIQRDLENAKQTYANLVNTQQDLQIMQNQQMAHVEVMEVAEIPLEGTSGKLALMVLGVMLGLFLSTMTVNLLEKQDRTLKTISEVKQKLPYNVLGMIPFEPESHNQGIVVQTEPDSFTSEIYRMIQTSLKFVASQSEPKVILITSSVPGEGKSTVTANLGAAIAQLGRKVLLIDGDLRRSHQHELWGVSNKAGIKEIITQQVPLKKVVSRPMSKLDLLTPGIIPPNPLALLDSTEMKSLIAQGRREYDLVLIDAPPLPVTADVLTLSQLADGIIFVSRPGVVEHESAELAKETLANTGQKILGMTINGIHPKEFERHSYHGKYGKSYFSSKSSNKTSDASKTTIPRSI